MVNLSTRILENISQSVNESMGDKTMKVFHGTIPKFVDGIKKNGLVDANGYNQGWFMVASDFESALFHAHPDEKLDFTYVFEFDIPNKESEKWDGFPYLWLGTKFKDGKSWYALKQKLPKEFISKIHKVPYSKWMKQKNVGF